MLLLLGICIFFHCLLRYVGEKKLKSVRVQKFKNTIYLMDEAIFFKNVLTFFQFFNAKCVCFDIKIL